MELPVGQGARAVEATAAKTALAALAVILTVLNAAVPLTGDDGAYHVVAQHFRAAPFDPYRGSFVFWGVEWPPLVFLAPPVLPYWWALAIAIFGDHAIAAKLALLPFAAILVAALHALFRRFADAAAMPFTWIAVLSPWILPSFNAMLDVPALALALSAVAVYLRAADRSAWALAIAAGALAGLAMQTKYTAATAPAVMLLHGAMSRRPACALLAAAAAGSLFAGWEALIWSHYGQSHFVEAFSQRTGIWSQSVRLRQLLYGLVANTGPLACGILPLLAFALWRRPLAAIAAGLTATAALAAIAAGFDRWPAAAATGLSAERVPTLLTLCGLLGLAVFALFNALALRQWRDGRGAAPFAFLLGWLAIELAAYFVLSPFPAARRGIGVLVVALLIVAQALSAAPDRVQTRRAVRAAMPFAVVAGLAFWTLGAIDAANLVRLAEDAAAAARRSAGDAPAWFLSTLSFDHHAAASGLRPLLVGRTILHAGDRVVVAPADLLDALPWDRSRIEPLEDRRAGVDLGVRLSPDFFIGQIPIVAAADSRPSARIYRVAADGPLEAAPATPR